MPNDFLIAPIGELHTIAGPPGLRRGEALSETGCIKNAGVAVISGKIAEIAPAEEIQNKYDLPSQPARLVTPGLVDAHTHLVWGGDRADDFLRRCRGESYEAIAAAGGGILSTMAATRETPVEVLAHRCVKRAKFMAQKGTTTLEAKASYGLSEDGCRSELDALAVAAKAAAPRMAVTFMGAHAFPPDCSQAEFMSLLCERLIPLAARHEAKPQFCDVFCEEGAFSVEQAQQVLQAGIAHGMRPKIHADEFNDLGGVPMATALGAASCDHLLVTGKAGRRALAEAETAAVLMPGTAFYLGKPYADGRALADEGAAVALGTDFNPGSSMVCSMAFTAGLAVAKLGLSPAEALVAATANAAAAIGVDAGRCAVGMPADLCLWPCDSLEEFAWKFPFLEPTQVLIGGNALK